MKTLLLVVVMSFTVIVLNAQTDYFQSTELKTIDGITISSDEIIDPGMVTILVFWKSCNRQCVESMEVMQEIWLDSLKNSGVKLIGICVDGVGTWDHVKPFVYGNAWEFETYIDVNCDFRRAMNVNSVPCTILLDGKQNLICRYDGFCHGAQEMLCEKIHSHTLASLD